jgi:hypothetical protein
MCKTNDWQEEVIAMQVMNMMSLPTLCRVLMM